MAGAYRETMPRRGRGQGHADAQHNLRLMRDKFVHSGVLFGSSTARGAFRSRRFALLPREKKLAPELAPDNAERAGKRSDLAGLSLRRYSQKTGQNVTPSDGQGRRSHALPLHADHRDTNNEELDPDHWVAVQGPSRGPFCCLTSAFG